MSKTPFNSHQSPKTGRKRYYLIVGLLALALIAIAGYFILGYDDNSTSGGEVSSVSDKAGVEGDNGISEAKKTDGAIAQPPDSIDSTASLEIIEKSSDAKGVRVSVRASGITPTRCQFSFSSPESRPVVKEVAASGSTCGPLEVAAVEFDKIGEWNISITAYNPEQRVVTQGTVTVQ